MKDNNNRNIDLLIRLALESKKERKDVVPDSFTNKVMRRIYSSSKDGSKRRKAISITTRLAPWLAVAATVVAVFILKPFHEEQPVTTPTAYVTPKGTVTKAENQNVKEIPRTQQSDSPIDEIKKTTKLRKRKPKSIAATSASNDPHHDYSEEVAKESPADSYDMAEVSMDEMAERMENFRKQNHHEQTRCTDYAYTY